MDVGRVSDVADCEARDGWFLAQDVNGWTSLAHVAVGALVVYAVLRRRVPRSFAALGGLAMVEGVGSMLYHGGSGDLAQRLHDVPLLAALGFVAGWHVGRVVGKGGAAHLERGALVGALCATVVGAGASVVGAGATNGAVGTIVVVLVASELVAHRRGLTPVWTVALAGLLAIALAFWAAGASNSPICDGESWLQPHGVWHVLTALVLLAWVDRAAAVQRPEHPPRFFRRATDRALGLLTKVVTHAFYRSVDVIGRERLPRGQPVLVVANHANGFVDPVVVSAVLGRLPRFMAKAALWKVPVARPFLALAGVLPVHRSSDGDRPGDNRSVFEACHRELAHGATVAIFPEGTTGDRAGLDRVRAGAARIALGAVAGAPDLVIAPIGLAFESRVETRSRAVVMVGDPIEVGPRASGAELRDGEPDRDDVRRLTADIASALEAVSPEFASVEERDVMRAAARTTLNDARRRGEARFGEIEVLARRLATARPESRAAVSDAFRRYATELQLAGLVDRELAPASTSPLRLALSFGALVILGSLVATATLIHLPALALVVVATGAVHSTATKGTARVLVGLVSGLLTWTVAGIVIADGAAAVLAGTLVAMQGAVALAVWTPLTRVAAVLWGRARARDRGSLLDRVLAERAALVAAVGAAVRSSTGAATDQATDQATGVATGAAGHAGDRGAG